MHYPSFPVIQTNPNKHQTSHINKTTKTDIIHIIINENRKANALYIIAKLKNEPIEVTIDSGANINCIRPDLIDVRQISLSHKYQLSGPDNTPLKLLGTTNIELTIDNKIFNVQVCVIKNLSSTIILGNEFLSNNKAKIDYNKKIITLNKNIKTKIMNNKFPQIVKFIENNENIIKSGNIIESNMDILSTTPKFSIAHCISADLKHNTDLSHKLTEKYGNMSFIFENSELIPGKIFTIDAPNRTIHYLITREKHNQPTSYLDIYDTLNNLKNAAIIEGHSYIALSAKNLINSELQWEIIKNMIFEIFNKTEINILVCNFINYPDKKKVKSNIISNIKNKYNCMKEQNNSNNTDYPQFINIFSKYHMGENVLSDGNCGLYAIINAINDNKNKNIINLGTLLKLLELSELPNYWWHDDELASIGNHYGFDTYIYSNKTKDGYVYGSGFRPPIILYNINNGTHWCPGTLIKNNKISNKIPKTIIHTENYISIEHIKSRCRIEQSLNMNIKKPESLIINTININKMKKKKYMITKEL
jgi:hypothetical protein